MNDLGIISNPTSGGNRRRPRDLTALAGVRPTTTPTQADLGEALTGLLARAPAALAVDGGDGTMQAVLTHLLAEGVPPRLPPLAALPVGSTNMTARDVCGVTDSRRALQAFLRLRDLEPQSWPLRDRYVLRVRAPERAPVCGLFFGVGAIVRGIRFWESSLAHGSRLGELASGLALARALVGILRGEARFAAPTHATFRMDDGDSVARRLSFALVTPMQKLFLGIRPFWGGGAGALACTLVDADARRLLRRLPALLRGDEAAGLAPENGFESRRAARLTVELDDAWVVDGEVFETPGRLEVDAVGPVTFVDLSRLT